MADAEIEKYKDAVHRLTFLTKAQLHYLRSELVEVKMKVESAIDRLDILVDSLPDIGKIEAQPQLKEVTSFWPDDIFEEAPK